MCNGDLQIVIPIPQTKRTTKPRAHSVPLQASNTHLEEAEVGGGAVILSGRGEPSTASQASPPIGTSYIRPPLTEIFYVWFREDSNQ